MKDIEQYFPVVLFIMLYKVVLTFESVDEILKCDHSNESYWAVLFCGAVIMLYKLVVLTFESVDKIIQCLSATFKLSRISHWYCLFNMPEKLVLAGFLLAYWAAGGGGYSHIKVTGVFVGFFESDS